MFQVFVLIIKCKFDNQYRSGVTANESFNGRSKHLNVTSELNHRAVDQLHRGRIELNQMLGRIHGLIKRWKVTHAEHPVFRQRPKLERDVPAVGKGALGTHQDIRHIALICRQ